MKTRDFFFIAYCALAFEVLESEASDVRPEYYCSHEGLFPDYYKDPCVDYYQCISLADAWFYYPHTCNNGTVFDDVAQSCSPQASCFLVPSSSSSPGTELSSSTAEVTATNKPVVPSRTTLITTIPEETTLTSASNPAIVITPNPLTTTSTPDVPAITTTTPTSTTTQKPTMTTPKPTTTTRKPTTTTRKPITTTPKPTTTAPKPTTISPKPTPTTTTRNPTTTTPKPTTTTPKQTTTTPKPTMTTPKPTTTTPKPTTTTRKPTTTTQKPTKTTRKPTTTTQKPTTTTRKPTTTTQKPTTTTRKPTTTTQKPTTTTPKPTTTTAKPSNEFECTAEGYFGDSKDCGIYHACIRNWSSWVHHVMQCPAGLVYCEQGKFCGWRHNCPDIPCLQT